MNARGSIARLALVLLAVLFVALPAHADLPQPLSPYVSDFAGVLDDAAEGRLTAALQALRTDPGVEVAVATLHRRADYGRWDGIEAFAKDLFNLWGIGAANRNDGILIVLAIEDREARIALGAGYPPVWDGRAQRVMDVLMVPRFVQGDYAGGLEAGVSGLETNLIRPFLAGQPYESLPELAAPDDPTDWAGLGMFAAFVALIMARMGWSARHRIGDILASRRPCPRCGGTGIVIETSMESPPGETTGGERLIRRRCPACGWHDDRHEPVPAQRAGTGSGSDGFGGGRSSGGGATGRW